MLGINSKRIRLLLFLFIYLDCLLIIALLAPYIANDRPLYATYKGYTLYPAFSSDNRTDSIQDPINGKFEILTI